MLADWQLFWHKHNKRPFLPSGFMPNGGNREVMKDDGSIVEEYQPSMGEIWQSSGAAKTIKDLADMPCPTLKAFRSKYGK